MRKTEAILALAWMPVLLVSCGGPNQLQSILVNPAVAAGQAQFTATGVFSSGTKVTPFAVTWGNCDPANTGACTLSVGYPPINSAGMTQCGPVPGTFTFWGSALSSSRLVSGQAQLTCP